MRKHVDYNLLVQAEKVRFQSDFSAAHWLNLVILSYERGIANKLRREAYEKVLRVAIHSGCRAAIKFAKTYPPVAGFPSVLRLSGGKQWQVTKKAVLNNFPVHETNRFHYLRQGD